jgi:hypothetical protein
MIKTKSAGASISPEGELRVMENFLPTDKAKK